MGQFDQIFQTILNAKPTSSFLPRLAAGRHKLAIKRYAPKNSQSNMGVILESDFVVVESSSIPPGEIRGWPWFIQAQGWSGTYEQDRAKQFLAAVAQSVPGGATDGLALGDELTNGKWCGLLVLCDVSQQLERDGSTPKRDKKGQPTFNATWSAIPGQTLESIAAMRARVDQVQGPAAASPVAAQAPAPQGIAPTAAPAFGGFGQPTAAVQTAPAPAPTPAAPAAAPSATNPLAHLFGNTAPKPFGA